MKHHHPHSTGRPKTADAEYAYCPFNELEMCTAASTDRSSYAGSSDLSVSDNSPLGLLPPNYVSPDEVQGRS